MVISIIISFEEWMDDKRREVIRKQVQIIFYESKQRLGAKRICAILEDRGI